MTTRDEERRVEAEGLGRVLDGQYGGTLVRV